MPKVGDVIVKDGKNHKVISVSKVNPDHYATQEIVPPPPATLSDRALLERIALKLGVSLDV